MSNDNEGKTGQPSDRENEGVEDAVKISDEEAWALLQKHYDFELSNDHDQGKSWQQRVDECEELPDEEMLSNEEGWARLQERYKRNPLNNEESKESSQQQVKEYPGDPAHHMSDDEAWAIRFEEHRKKKDLEIKERFKAVMLGEDQYEGNFDDDIRDEESWGDTQKRYKKTSSKKLRHFYWIAAAIVFGFILGLFWKNIKFNATEGPANNTAAKPPIKGIPDKSQAAANSQLKDKLQNNTLQIHDDSLKNKETFLVNSGLTVHKNDSIKRFPVLIENPVINKKKLEIVHFNEVESDLLQKKPR